MRVFLGKSMGASYVFGIIDKELCLFWIDFSNAFEEVVENMVSYGISILI